MCVCAYIHIYQKKNLKERKEEGRKEKREGGRKEKKRREEKRKEKRMIWQVISQFI